MLSAEDARAAESLASASKLPACTLSPYGSRWALFRIVSAFELARRCRAADNVDGRSAVHVATVACQGRSLGCDLQGRFQPALILRRLTARKGVGRRARRKYPPSLDGAVRASAVSRSGKRRSRSKGTRYSRRLLLVVWGDFDAVVSKR